MITRKLLRKLMDGAGLNPNSLAKATGGRTKQPQIFRFLSNTSMEPKRSTLLPVAEYFGISVEAFFDEELAEQLLADLKSSRDRASTVRHDQAETNLNNTPPAQGGAVIGQTHSTTFRIPSIQWADLLSTDLVGLFQTQMADDSMAPELPKGSTVAFMAGIEPRAQDFVLVKDGDDNLYVREMRQGRPGRRWQAYALNTAYLPLDSENDSLEVLAVFHGRLERRSTK